MTHTPPVPRFAAGDAFPSRVLRDIDGADVPIPDPGGAWVHLQLRRYAGCPICSLHLRSFAQRHGELRAAGVLEVAVFHSTAEELRAVHKQPFAVVPDPDKRLYAELGVGTSAGAVLDPRVWPTAMRAVASGASSDPSAGRAGGSFGLPADFLITPGGVVAASKYGVHADDQWSLDELLALLPAARASASR